MTASHTLLLPLLALGCGMTKTSTSAQADIEEYLRSTYGEEFVIDRVRRATGTMGQPQLTPLFPYKAHPVRDSGIMLSGSVDYSGWTPVFRDDYPCAQVRQWLPALLEETVPNTRLNEPRVFCTKTDLPSHPPPGDPLPKGVSIRGDLGVFRPGDPATSVETVREEANAFAERLSFRLDVSVTAYPPDAWTVAKDYQRDGPMSESWQTLRLARADSQTAAAPVVWTRNTALEKKLAAAIRAGRPGARVGVWAQNQIDPQYRPNIDVRVAEDGLDPVTLRALGVDLRPLTKDHHCRLRGIDKAGPEAPQIAAWTCSPGGPCSPRSETFIDPIVLQAD